MLGYEKGCEKGRGREGGWTDAVDVGRGVERAGMENEDGEGGWVDGEGDGEE